MLENQDSGPDLVTLTSEVVAAYVAHSSISPKDLSALISDVHSALRTVHAVESGAPATEEQKPAVSIRKSVTAENITCLECGLTFKSLKRHIRTDHELSPDQYRAKWNLPADYPMTAPAYSERRSELAKSHGLGRKAANSRAKK